MAGSTHIIRQQKLHISFHESVRPEALSLRLSRLLNERILPAMEAVLNELDLPDVLTRIETLSIDVGEIEGEDWERQLTEKICRLLRQQLNEAHGLRTPVVTDVRDERKLTLYAAAEKQKLVLAYLQSGHLPWYAAVDVSELMEWMAQLVKEGFFSKGEGSQALRDQATAFHRFLRQAKPALLEEWAAQWVTQLQLQWLPGIISISRKLFGQTHAALEWSYALLLDTKEATANPLWEILLQRTTDASQQFTDRTQFSAGNQVNAIEQFVTITKQFIRQQIPFQQWQEKTAELDLPTVQKKVNKQASGERETSERKEYFINNAGLVLLHPFLKTFFANLSLLDEKAGWVTEQAHRRGVLLCHYLCTGQTEVAEYELPLCKLLTGYPFHQPVEATLDLSAAEIAEAEALLQSVISQWTMLKSTSPEGLRNSFLVREGKLSRQDNGWLLQVQQKGFDILLDHLPWSIGVIKNSWMENMLFTEWT
jgi:hypothetical protein